MFYRFSICLITALYFIPDLHGQETATFIGRFPDEIQESSGLLLQGDRFITHNDSGNLPMLYEVDTASLEIVRRITVEGVQNRDWEALAEDDNFLYIGDFGNNQGNRRDLKILRILKSAFYRNDTVMPDLISFAYEDQETFNPTPRSDWDAEAMIVQGDSLWIFTKQWQRKGTTVYRLPKSPGTYLAKRVADYKFGSMVTAAIQSPVKEEILLLSYTAQLQPVLHLIPWPFLKDRPEEAIDKHMLSIGFAQAEGIVLTSEGVVYVSSEAFANRLVSLPAGIYKLDLATETSPKVQEEDVREEN